MDQRTWRQLVRVAAIVGADTALLVLIGRLYPDFAVEGGILQTATALLFFAAWVLAGMIAMHPGTPRGSRVTMTAVSAVALILGLSEISFGAGLLDISMPAMKGGGEFDGAHDIVILSLRYFAEWPTGAQAVALAAVLAIAAVAARWAWRRRAALQRIASDIAGHPGGFLFAVTFGVLAAAVMLDLLSGWTVALTEEALEAIAGVTMLGGVVRMYAPSGASQRFFGAAGKPDLLIER